MKVFILFFGAIAGLLGIFGSLAAIAVQIQQQATGSGEAVFGPWLITLALSALGLYGARHALGRPMLSSTVMASAAVGGLLSVTWFFALPAVIFWIASALGFLWRNETTYRPTDA
jgi:hypothetical protein